MKVKYPQLSLCCRCKRHGTILLSLACRSMGFMTKQTGFAIIKAFLDRKLINEQQYRQLYRDICTSPLARRSDHTTPQDHIILLRLVYIHAETIKGARLLEPYFACGKEDPVLVKTNPDHIVKADLN